VFVFNIGANVPSSILEETGAQVLQGLGDGVLRRLPDRAQGGALHGAARQGHHAVHRRDRPRCAARPTSAPSRAPRRLCARWRRAWRASSGPRGIHVAHVVIDGAIDTAFIRENFPERYALKEQEGILNPDHIADSYWMLHSQPRDAWTHELDLRPWMEKF
jgi:hypothetical protein